MSALITTLLDPSAEMAGRDGAARRLGFVGTAAYRAVAVAGLRGASGRLRCDIPAGQPGVAFHWTSPRRGVYTAVIPDLAVGACAGVLPLCAGIGPAVDLADLPRSLDGARAALRFTAAGTRVDPGPRVVRFDDLGALTLLADLGVSLRTDNPDLDRVVRARSAAEWGAATMLAVAQSSSLRRAAKTLYVHHSTLAERVLLLEALLGYSLREPAGRRRLDLALTIDRLRVNADLDWSA